MRLDLVLEGFRRFGTNYAMMFNENFTQQKPAGKLGEDASQL